MTAAPRSPLMPLDEALARLLAQAAPVLDAERVPTMEADGRVLAQDLVSALTVPPRDNSAMDGYAVRAADCAALGTVLPVTQRIPAGSVGQPLTPGSAARIFTGAPIPEGADAVVIQEDTEALDGGTRVRIDAPPASGQWVRPAGEDIERGAVVLRKGELLAPAGIGLAAGIGLNELAVSRRPRVALMSTGDELVMPGAVAPEQMPPGAIYNSNRYFLSALLRRAGCVVTDLGAVPDRREVTLQALQAAARDHDLVLTSGGVSVGEEDHVKPAALQLGALDLWQIAMKPGKPFAYGHLRQGGGGQAHFIGLPGNPVSSFVTFLMLVRPFILRRMGVEDCLPHSIRLPAGFDWPRPDRRREFLRARVGEAGQVELFPNQGPGVLSSTVWAAGLVDNPAGHAIAQGEPVSFIPYSELLS